MIMQPISVIIVSWNARDFLRGCLRSLEFCVAGLIAEVIVIDNASSDGSAEMVQESFPAVKLIRSDKNLGFARANNLGMQHAVGRQFALINSDVTVHPHCLEILSAYLEEHPGVGMVGPFVFGADGKPQETLRRLPTLRGAVARTLSIDRIRGKMGTFDLTQPQAAEVMSGCFWLVKREAVEEVGGLDERFFFYAEDVDWCKRFRELDWAIHFVPAAHAVHYGGGSSSHAPLRFSIELVRANLTYWKKHGDPASVGVIYALCIVHHGLRLLARSLILSFTKPDASSDVSYKYQRSKVCLKWLLTGREIN